MKGKNLYPILHGWWLECACIMENIMIPIPLNMETKHEHGFHLPAFCIPLRF
jgi:hypothetical protein